MTFVPQQKFGIGQPARRKEDAALIQGQGRYVADFQAAGAAQAFVVRSPYAHARFTIGDLEPVRSAPGVLLVLTAPDVADLGALPCKGLVTQVDGSKPTVPPYRVLAEDTVRHVGDAVAFIVAETLDDAKSAAELMEIDWEPLDPVVDGVAALQPGAPQIWPTHPGNLAFEAEHGDRAATQAAFGRAHRVISVELVNNRLVTNYLETRGVLAEYDRTTERFTLTLGSQGSHGLRDLICGSILKIPESRMRVITPEVGGGFGTKIFLYREYPLAAVAAERLGRPVRWIAERSEHFVADTQGRDNVSKAELAVDQDGRFLGLKVDTVANLGAYLNQYAPFVAFGGSAMVAGLYRTPAIHVRVRGAFTNTVPVDAYRGAGRPEAAYLIERLVGKAALELGIPPHELRRRNFIQPDQLPYATPTKHTYDSGDFEGHMTRALELSDWQGFEARRAESLARGKLRGIGLSCYVEACSGGGPEWTTVSLEKDGTATVLIGSQSNGQGHVTAYAQLASEHLGLPLDKITVIQGDTDLIARGSGTGGSRSIPVGGAAVNQASRTLAGRVKELASDLLEASAGDIELVGGFARVAGTDRMAPLAEVAAKATSADQLVIDDKWTPPDNTYPNGSHVCELEVDPDTGMVEILRYSIVDDFGKVMNPLLLAGQVHGGVAQGIGQALHERTVYDESGQLLTATLQDYTLPRADDLSFVTFETRNVPSITNALGMKGAGEAGAIGSCPAVINALVDALHPVTGLTHIDMPATPERVWAALAPYRQRAAA